MVRKRSLEEMTSSYHDWLIESLKDSHEAEAYLQASLDEYQKDGRAEVLLLAFRNVAEAQGGVGELAKKTKLNRESLYRTLSVKGNPKLQTLGLLLSGLGFRLSIQKI